MDFPGGSEVKNPLAKQEAWVGKTPREGNGNSFQYSSLENPMDRGAWQAIVHRFAESDATNTSLLV